MKIFGKPVSDYFAFQKGILILILLVGLGRLGLSLAGVSSDVVKWLSLTAMAIVGTAYVGVQVPRTGFGGFKHLLPLLVLQVEQETLEALREGVPGAHNFAVVGHDPL